MYKIAIAKSNNWQTKYSGIILQKLHRCYMLVANGNLMTLEQYD